MVISGNVGKTMVKQTMTNPYSFFMIPRETPSWRRRSICRAMRCRFASIAAASWMDAWDCGVGKGGETRGFSGENMGKWWENDGKMRVLWSLWMILLWSVVKTFLDGLWVFEGFL